MTSNILFDRKKLEAMSLLLSPDSIAFVGASKDPKHVGGIAIDHLLDFGYKGEVYPINPKYDELFGFKCYGTLNELPAIPDVVVIALSVHHVMPALEDAHAKGIKAAIIYASGYAEENAAGLQRQLELIEFSKRTGMLICGPNCMGLADLNSNAITAFATLFKDFPPIEAKGNVSVITQSGNMCIVLYASGRQRGVQFKYFINTGNEACLEFAEYLHFLALDQDTQVIIGYLEGLKNGPRFIAIAEKLRQEGKALILLRAGETDRGAVAAQSHTASLAGDLEINRTAFKQIGIMQATDPSHAADIAYLAKSNHAPKGKRVAILSISGAMGALLTDLLINGGMHVPEFSNALQETLRDQAGNIGMVSNPIDTTAALYKEGGIAKAVLETLSKSNEIDIIIIYATGYLLDRITYELIDVAKNSEKYILAIDTGKAKTIDILEAAAIPVFFDVARATKALTTFSIWCSERNQSLQWGQLRRSIVENATTCDTLPIDNKFDEYQAKNLLAKFGLSAPTELIAKTANEAVIHAQSIGFPVVLKILSPDILHKTEIGGVKLNLNNAIDVTTAFETISSSAAVSFPYAECRGVLVQKMEKGICELIVGVTRDPIFGLAITVGVGGIFTEILQDAVHRLLPVDESIALEMLQELKGFPLLAGFRKSVAGDIDSACHAIAAISCCALALDESLVELEINPMLVKKIGLGTVALDALIVLKDQ